MKEKILTLGPNGPTTPGSPGTPYKTHFKKLEESLWIKLHGLEIFLGHIPNIL